MYDNLKKYCFKLVASFTEKDWNGFKAFITVKNYKKGDLIFKQGAIAEKVSYINKGLVRVFVETEDKTISTGFLGLNNFISPYDSFLNRTPSLESLDAVMETELLELNYEHVQFLYKN